MAGFRKYDEHAKLLERMADKLGVDMDEEMQSGRVTPDDVEDTVYRCMSCENPENCTAWLDSRDGVQVEEPPQYCRNRAKLGALRND